MKKACNITSNQARFRPNIVDLHYHFALQRTGYGPCFEKCRQLRHEWRDETYHDPTLADKTWVCAIVHLSLCVIRTMVQNRVPS